MKLRYCIQAGFVALAAMTAGVSCTDTWDDHYSVGGTVPGSTLWENIMQDETLRSFAEVLDSCGYKDILNSNQVYSVWAPEITDAEAKEWIESYKNDSKKDKNNVTIKQFIRNHIALFNNQTSKLTDDTITMMNNKRMARTDLSFSTASLVGTSVPSSNGVLYKIDSPVAFTPNIWERVEEKATGGDDGLDSLYNFFESWNQEELDESASVPGGVVNGKTEYLDSVMYEYNSAFNEYGRIDSEDSLYWLLAPTNKVWRENLDKFKPYFTYHSNRAEEGDSLQDLYAKLFMVSSEFFNVRNQPGKNFNINDPDSICSTAYNRDKPGYYMFERPLDPDGIFYGLTPIECSNGNLYKTADWRISPTKTLFMSEVKVEGENSYYYSTIPLGATEGSTAYSAIQVSSVSTNSDKYKVSGSGYIVVRDTRTDRNNQPEISYSIPDVLSKCPYDIKVVFATPLAADTLNTADAQLKRQITAKIRYYSSTTGSIITDGNAITLCSGVDVDATKMDTVTVASGYTFPVCTYGEEDPSVFLTIQSIQGRTTAVPTGYSKDLYIDCVIFEPRPDLDSAGK
ncbi:MAG: hypothetical protein LUC45_00925 [Paraprevotella sp.]|nr:hypothetical protein [Paraprevotella sp.]